jgi:hypothetical protein
MELVIESFDRSGSFCQANRTGKKRQVVKFLMKRRILMETVPFKKKVKRIRKSIWEDLVSPRKKHMDLSVNILKTRDKKERQNK